MGWIKYQKTYQCNVHSSLIFGSLGFVIFYMMVSVCKTRQERLLKSVNKRKVKMGWKAHKLLSSVTKMLFIDIVESPSV